MKTQTLSQAYHAGRRAGRTTPHDEAYAALAASRKMARIKPLDPCQRYYAQGHQEGLKIALQTAPERTAR